MFLESRDGGFARFTIESLPKRGKVSVVVIDTWIYVHELIASQRPWKKVITDTRVDMY